LPLTIFKHTGALVVLGGLGKIKAEVSTGLFTDKLVETIAEVAAGGK
jgi:hypothetical protein